MSRKRTITPPYITKWSSERTLHEGVVERYGRIAYDREKPEDRDENGILWFQSESRRGQGNPEFKAVHPQRQREVMSGLLCQVCAGPADQNDDGVLWLLIPRSGSDWEDWPCGLSRFQISRWEIGDNKPEPGSLRPLVRGLADALRESGHQPAFSLADLLGDS